MTARERQKTIAEGLAAAGRRLYIATEDGKLACFGGIE